MYTHFIYTYIRIHIYIFTHAYVLKPLQIIFKSKNVILTKDKNESLTQNFLALVYLEH